MFLDVCTQTKCFGGAAPDRGNDPQTVVVYPVFAKSLVPKAEIVGHLVAVIPWNVFFGNILSSGSAPVTVVMSNTCNEVFSYSVEGHEAVFIAKQDAHDKAFDSFAIQDVFSDFANPQEALDLGIGEHCVYTITVYPIEELEQKFLGNKPFLYMGIILAIFFFTSLVFVLYDAFVKRRQLKIMQIAARANEIVSVGALIVSAFY